MANKNPFAAALGATGNKQSGRTFTEALSNASSGSSGYNPANARSILENNPFGDSINSPGLDQFGGTNGPMQDFGGFDGFPGSMDPMKKQEDELKKQEFERKRLELHNKVNPVDSKDLFDARREQTKNKIEQIRKELKNLALEIKKFNKDVDIVLMGKATNSGLDGIGDENFFDRLRTFIILLTQRVRSARTWAQQAATKKKKIAARGKGLGKQMAESSGFEQRANMEEFFNSERGDNFGE